MDDNIDHIRASKLFLNAKHELDRLGQTTPPRKPPTQRDLITALYPDTIEPLLNKGFTVPQIRESLLQAGCSITESTLRSALSRLRTTTNGGMHRKRKPRQARRNLKAAGLSQNPTPVASDLKTTRVSGERGTKSLVAPSNAPRPDPLHTIDEKPRYQPKLLTDARCGFPVYEDDPDL